VVALPGASWRHRDAAQLNWSQSGKKAQKFTGTHMSLFSPKGGERAIQLTLTNGLSVAFGN